MVLLKVTYLAKLCLGSILTCSPRQKEAKPIVKTKRIKLLCVKHPFPALGHAQEPLLVIKVHCVLVDLVPLLCSKDYSLSEDWNPK